MPEVRMKLNGPQCPKCKTPLLPARIQFTTSKEIIQVWYCFKCGYTMPRNEPSLSLNTKDEVG